jgi:hypothetical protein
VGERLVDAQNQALDDLARTQEDLEEMAEALAESTELIRKRRRRVRRGALIIAGLLGISVALAVVGLFLWSAAIVAVLAAVCAVSFFGSIAAILGLAAGRVRLRHRIEEHEKEPARIFARRQQAASEFTRLTSLYEQYQDWAGILSAVLHRPWGTSARVQAEPWRTATGALSFVCGWPTTPAPEVSGAPIAVAQHVATKGWILRAFSARRAAWLEWYESNVRGLMDLAPNPEADCLSDVVPLVDVPARDSFESLCIHRPRRQFRTAMERGDFVADYRREQLEQLRSILNGYRTTGLIATVTSDVPALSHTDERPVDASKFLRGCTESATPPLGSSRALVAGTRVGDPVGQQTWVGISPSIDATPCADATVMPVVDVPDRIVLASFRLDVSDAVALSDCTLIANDPPDDPFDEPGPVGSPSPPDNGRFG